MNIKKELKEMNMESELVSAKLAVAYTLLALAPYDNWGHEGSPSEMAAYVVGVSKQRGSFGFLSRAIAPEYWGSHDS